jgi:hypothetical protein
MSDQKPTTVKEDLESHPELAPMLDVDSRGNVVCFGWVSPVYDFSMEDLSDQRKIERDR